MGSKAREDAEAMSLAFVLLDFQQRVSEEESVPALDRLDI